MYYVAVKEQNGDYKHHEVSKEVYFYIRQLEMYVLYPEQSNLKQVYHERFGEEK